MSDYIPFHVQSEIIKWLPEKSLLRFRTVSKAWKAHIDTNHTRRLLVCYELDNVRRYISIIDDNTVPLQMIHLTAPESLSSLRKLKTLASDAGLLGFYGDVDSNTKMAVIWNPTIGKSVGIYINPNRGYEHTIVGFGVCHFDPKLVKISVKQSFNGRPVWDVDVFSLSTRDWRNVHMDMQPFRGCKLECAKSGVFRNVPFPGELVRAVPVQAAKVNESLGILHYHHGVCEVWTKEEGANVTFDMKYIVEVEGQRLYYSVLGFRNNGEVVLEDDNFKESRIEVYDPSSGGHITIGDIGIYGTRHKNSARSYMETAYLIDQPEPDIIIH